MDTEGNPQPAPDSSPGVPGKKEKKDKKGPDKKQLTIDRAVLAHERTMLASVRTATTLMTFGFALFKFLEVQAEQQGHSHLLDVIPPRAIGLTMMITGLTGLTLAIIRHFKTINLLKQYSQLNYFTPALLQAYVIFTLILVLIYGTLLH